jgi:hypothetical protein
MADGNRDKIDSSGGEEEDQGKERQGRQTERPVRATTGQRKQSRSVEWNEVRNGSSSDDSDRDGVGNSIGNRGDSVGHARSKTGAAAAIVTGTGSATASVTGATASKVNVDRRNEVGTRGSMADGNRNEIDSSGGEEED